jgi:choline dehydrogenase-like flavoprotein
MTYGSNVGIAFREAMSGYLQLGVKDPGQGALAGAGKDNNFAFDLDVRIPSLRAFLNAPTHQAQVAGGKVTWTGRVAADSAVQGGGSIVMYRNVTPDGRKKGFDFNFSFLDRDGRFSTVMAEKRLSDDAGFDAAADLSTLFVKVLQDGPTIAAGITRVHVDELLGQIASLQVTGTTNEAERMEARGDFLTFMNHRLSQVYRNLPFLFRLDPDRYLRASEWRALSLVLRVLLPESLPPNGPTIDDAAANLEVFVRNADADAVEQIRVGLRLLGAVAPFASGFVPEIRKQIRAVLEAGHAPELRPVAELLHRVAVLPYFAHPKADGLVRYHRPTFSPAHNTRLAVSNRPSQTDYDVIVVGAGVAGSILAERLSRGGKRVLLLEAGEYLAERDMSSDDLVMTARLYKSSGLQLINPDGAAAAKYGTFTVLQGRCVGGGGTVNNAICFQLPVARLAAWHALGFPISASDMAAGYAATAQELSIKPASEATSRINPAGAFLHALGQIQKPAVDQPPSAGIYECLVNLAGGEKGCQGLGLCNSGCGSERKLNALQVHLPRALAQGTELVPNARVVDFELSPAGSRVEAVLVELDGRRERLKAKEFVLCAGAIASSALLLAAPQLNGRLAAQGIPVGKRFSANVGSPLFARFRRVVQERPSLQISHYYLPPDAGAGFLIESWFAPPGSLSVVMPGYFETHWERMMSYTRTITAAPLVGTAATGSVSVDQNRKPRVELPIDEGDLESLRRGTATLAAAFLDANDSDLLEVVAGTSRGFSITKHEDIAAYRAAVTSSAQLRLGTGHPQGGNAMSRDPELSVLDESFRVRTLDNLRVCDASAFPEVAGVNPQWTVMALAHHCASLMV